MLYEDGTQTRTGAKRFAIYGLTTWLYRHNLIISKTENNILKKVL